MDKASSVSGVRSEVIPNQEKADTLNKPIVKKIEKQKFTILAMPV